VEGDEEEVEEEYRVEGRERETRSERLEN